ncbi:MAG: hypothetical protein AABW71_04245 [Nanoarchaeota archaeon]
MSFIKGAGVFILSLISIFLLILLSFGFTFSSFLQPEVYFDAFESAGVYIFLEENLNNAGSATFIDFSEGVRPVFNGLFANFLSYMSSKTDVLDLTVKINQEKLRNFFLDSVGNIDECSQGQNPFDEQNPCLPEGLTRDEFLDAFFEANNISFFDRDIVDLTEVYGIEVGSEQRESLDNLRNYIAYYKASKIILIILILITISLIFVLQQPNTKKSLRIAGIIFIIPALILFFLSMSVNRVDQYIQIPDPIFESMINVVKNVLSSNFLVYSGVIGALGLALFISSFIIKRTPLSIDKKKQTKKKL